MTRAVIDGQLFGHATAGLQYVDRYAFDGAGEAVAGARDVETIDTNERILRRDGFRQ